jgi:hypothetical protein
MFDWTTAFGRMTGCGVSVRCRAVPAWPQYRNTCPLAPTLIVVSTAQKLRFRWFDGEGEAPCQPFSTS